MLFFGSFDLNNQAHSWSLTVLPCFILIGALGGFFGGALNWINAKLLPLRKKYIHISPFRRGLEVFIVVLLTTLAIWLIVRSVHECVEVPPPPHETNYWQFGCPAVCSLSCPFSCVSLLAQGTYNDMATIMYNTQELAVNQVFHYMGHYRLLSLGLLFLVYYFSMVFSVGLTLSSGLLIPAILSGATFVASLVSVD